MSHHCHARGCTVSVKPELLMCFSHWRLVPKTVQRAVWRHYRAGQCDDKRPSREWHEAADAAIGYVAQLEGRDFNVAEARAMAALKVAPAYVIEGLKKIDAKGARR